MYIKREGIFSIKVATKKQAIKLIADKAKKLGITKSSRKLEIALNDRESQFSTGFENGFAIPHARIAEIKQPAILVAKFKEGIDWKSMDGKKTNAAIVILVPDNDAAGENHLKALSKVSAALIEDSFQQTIKFGKTPSILKALNDALTENDVLKKPTKKTSSKNVVAITACATGIAHTFMAAKKLEEVAKSKNISIRIQKNGASGPEDTLSEEEIKQADYVIIAADVVVDETVFEGKKVVKVPVAYAIKSTDELLDNLENDSFVYSNGTNAQQQKHNEKKSKQKSSWIYRNILTHVMNGVSHIIPLLVSAGVLLAIGKLLASFTGDVQIADNYQKLFAKHGDLLWYKFVYFINIMGIVVLWLMFPIFGLFTAKSIGGKSAAIPGFIVGILSDGDHLFARIWRTFNLPNGMTNPFLKGSYPFVQDSAGFFGVLVGSILIGYFVALLNKYIKIKGAAAPMKSILIVPGLSIIVAVIIQAFVINPPFALLNIGINDLARNSTSFVIGFGIFVAAATAFDLGGPVNKAVGAVAIGLAASGTIPLTARTMSIVIPPLGLGLATVIAKPIFRKNLYDQDLKVAGRTSLFLGLIAITEGGLPFLFKKPLPTIIASVMGAIVGSTFAILIGAQMWQPLPAIYGWGLVGQAPSNAAIKSSLAIWAQILVYIVGIIIGATVTAFTHIGAMLIGNKMVNKIEKEKMINNGNS